MNAKRIAMFAAGGAVLFVVLRVVEELVANAAPSASPSAIADRIMPPGGATEAA